MGLFKHFFQGFEPVFGSYDPDPHRSERLDHLTGTPITAPVQSVGTGQTGILSIASFSEGKI